MMWTLFLLLLPSLSRCAPPISRDLKPCDDSGPRVSQLSLDSALSTFLCLTEEEIGAMEEVDKKRKLAQTIAPLVRYEHSYEDLVEEIIKVPSDSLVKIVNEVMNNRNGENGHKTIDEYGAVFDEHRHLNNGLEDLNRKGRIAFLSNLESWFSLGEGLDDSPNTAPPQILTPSQTFRVSVGDSVILPCYVHDLGTLVPLWKYKEHILTAGRQMVNPDSFKYQLVNDYNLQIRNVRALDAGDYTCFIATFGQPVTLTHTIKILSLAPNPTDSGWSDWSEFGPCSATCGSATKKRERTCRGGAQCPGVNQEILQCTLSDCDLEECPWSTPTNYPDMMQCGDKTFCNVSTGLKWSCCHDHQGRNKCPAGNIMCSAKACGDGGAKLQHCCDTSCNLFGGPRPCEGCDGVWEVGVAYEGNDIHSCNQNRKSSAEECQQFCQSIRECIGWEWGFEGHNCCAKKALQNQVAAVGRISGKRNSCKVCTGGEVTSVPCMCQSVDGQRRKMCHANQKCTTDGTCVDGCRIEPGAIFRKEFVTSGKFFFPTSDQHECTGKPFLPEIKKLTETLEAHGNEMEYWAKSKIEHTIPSADEDALLNAMTEASAYLNNCREDRNCDWKIIIDFREKIKSIFTKIEVSTQVSSGFLQSYDTANEDLENDAHSLLNMPDCEFYKYSSECMCHQNRICTKTEGCARGFCFPICKPDSISNNCFCKNETGNLIFCEDKEGRCLSDGHCHKAFKVSDVSTSPVTASIGSTLWTNQDYKITKMPQELINSILFRHEDLVGKKTIQLSSPKDATIFLALNEFQDGGLMKELGLQEWGLKEAADDKWVVETDNPDRKLRKMWYRKIKENEPITFTTNEDGANFGIFFSTDCDVEQDILVNCFCKSAGKHCITGQECRKEGFCNYNPLAFFGK